MNISSFTSYKTGQLVDIVTHKGREAKAFVPEPLPGSWRMSHKLWPLVAKARDRVARLEQIQGILPNPSLLLRPLQRREALRSSSLEGTYATPEQLLLFEAEREMVRTRGGAISEEKNDHLEVYNYCEALRQGNNLLSDGRGLDLDLILTLHHILMRGVRGKDKEPGKIREKQVFVGRPPRYIPPPPACLASCLSSLIEFMQSDNDLDPLVRVFVVHYQFEAIHPFMDGNGRVGRLLLALCARHWIPLGLPWLYMSEFFERNRDDYFSRMFRVSSNGEWDEWIEFCLNGAIEQATEAIARSRKLQDVRDSYQERLGNRGRLNLIVDMLLDWPVLSFSQVAQQFGKSKQTARHDIKELCDLGILTELAGCYPKAFAASEIMEAAYGDSPVE